MSSVLRNTLEIRANSYLPAIFQHFPGFLQLSRFPDIKCLLFSKARGWQHAFNNTICDIAVHFIRETHLHRSFYYQVMKYAVSFFAH